MQIEITRLGHGHTNYACLHVCHGHCFPDQPSFFGARNHLAKNAYMRKIEPTLYFGNHREFIRTDV